jgi:hypothetical protein
VDEEFKRSSVSFFGIYIENSGSQSKFFSCISLVSLINGRNLYHLQKYGEDRLIFGPSFLKVL